MIYDIINDMKKFWGLLLLVGLLFVPTPAAADNTRIHVEPGTMKITLAIGQTADYSLKVRNLGETNYDFKIYAEPFYVSNYDYKTEFGRENNFTQISRWVVFPQRTFHLNVGETVEVPFSVVVPATAAGGGQYCAIFVEVVRDAAAAVDVAARVGNLVYGTVEGPAKREGNVEFTKPEFIQPEASFDLLQTYHNTGNVDYDSLVTVSIKDFITGAVVLETTESDKNIVLPETSRETSFVASNIPPGLYTISRETKVFGEVYSDESVVLVSPWVYFVIIGIIVLLVIILIIRAIRRNKRLNELIRENEELRKQR